ncbi:ATP-binding cassette domain-containing protein [Suttonella sp. R2A3]|uniref:ATP-binding cassette domain-containing protein n=1 Tax=Suttonella sp. R2A3 TaxID=2908648 RepID=UPI001F3DBDEA|nr:ATP-binding cassette domain-containing protein [Suttonella sp. R2A3]UJF23657.1 ATP-binding cassette domain-containing protein [Suttonella sp. R2A3]
MSLLIAQELTLAFGLQPLLDHVSFSVKAGERIALLGRNGEGKSTLLNVLRGEQTPDDGQLTIRDGVRIAYLPQDPPNADDSTVREVVAGGLADINEQLLAYQALLDDFSVAHAAEMEQLEAQINAADGWQIDSRIDAILTQFELDGTTAMADLSGGWRRRAWLARVLVARPDVLLLDEPTNHLDLAAIAWLEQTIKQFTGAVIFVTHDRAFMHQTATRIWHLDRGRLTDVVGTYERFLRTREELLHAEAEANAKFDKKLAEEEVWIRQGIKARRTRNEGRVRALKAMRAERATRIKQQGQAKLRLDSGERSGKQVIVAEDVHFTHEQGVDIIHDFNDIIERGEKIGVIGANGVGKTTLLNVLLGKLTPQQGTVTHGTKLSVAYFDQLRDALDETQTLRENLGQGKDYVEINGQRKHIASYLQDFLFSPQRWQTPVSALSGGERARLLLAKLFAQPVNVLVLDEPTNDLDIETLELLEEVLDTYTGTVLLVSHDRHFLDEVVTRSWVFNQAKGIIEHVPGGFDDWLRQGGRVEQLAPINEAADNTLKKTAAKTSAPANNTMKKKTPKLSYKYQRELEQLPELISAAEAEVERLNTKIADPAFHQQDHETQSRTYETLQFAQNDLDELVQRWIFLEEGDVPDE